MSKTVSQIMSGFGKLAKGHKKKFSKQELAKRRKRIMQYPGGEYRPLAKELRAFNLMDN